MNRWMTRGMTIVVLAAAFASAGNADVRRRNVMPDIRVLWLDTNGCTPQLHEAFDDKGYMLVADRGDAEGVLKVNVRQLDANTGASARFSADLHDSDGRPVWQTTGREDSINQEELCEDISEDIVERLERRKEAIG